jgi:Protein of unknown function (DUF2628)
MPAYTVHEPPPRDGGDALAAADRFVFVRDKFSLWAFVFGPVWMIWRGLWLVLLLYLVAMAALQATLWAVDAPAVIRAAVGLLIALLIGFEASTLRRWTLSRRGWINHGVVVGDDEETAERRFFDIWMANRGRPPAAAVATPATTMPAVTAAPLATAMPYRTAADPPDVVGLFPEPQHRP